MNKVKVGDLPTGAMFVTPLTHKIGSIRAIDQPVIGVPVYLQGEKKLLHPDVLVVPMMQWATEVTP